MSHEDFLLCTSTELIICNGRKSEGVDPSFSPSTGLGEVLHMFSFKGYWENPKSKLKDLGQFLALLDYVRKELMKSKFARRPSVASIISEVTAWIAFEYQLWLPLGHMPRSFFHF